MSVELESAKRIATLKSGIEAKTGETYADLTDGVNTLIKWYGVGKEIVLPDTEGRIYIALEPSDVEEVLEIIVEPENYNNTATTVVTMGQVYNGEFLSETILHAPEPLSGTNYKINIPAHDEIKVLEFKNTFEANGNYLRSCIFNRFCTPKIREVKINTPINIIDGGTHKSQAPISVRKWTMNADATSSSQIYKAFQYSGAEEIDLSRCVFASIKSVFNMFAFSATRKIVVPNLLDDTATATDLNSMFEQCVNLCEIVGLETWHIPSGAKLTKMFQYCQSLRELDLSAWAEYSTGFTKIDGFNRMCSRLKTLNLSGWNVSHLTSVYDLFDDNVELENIIMDGTTWIASNFSLASCTKLTVDSLMAVINALPEAEKTITLGSVNKAKLTAEQIAVATEKGWTVA